MPKVRNLTSLNSCKNSNGNLYYKSFLTLRLLNYEVICVYARICLLKYTMKKKNPRKFQQDFENLLHNISNTTGQTPKYF